MLLNDSNFILHSCSLHLFKYSFKYSYIELKVKKTQGLVPNILRTKRNWLLLITVKWQTVKWDIVVAITFMYMYFIHLFTFWLSGDVVVSLNHSQLKWTRSGPENTIKQQASQSDWSKTRSFRRKTIMNISLFMSGQIYFYILESSIFACVLHQLANWGKA